MPRYEDAFLARHVTTEREDAATAYVAEFGTFPAYWLDKLTTYRVYILICEEEQTGRIDDVYAAKLKTYQKEWTLALNQGRNKAVASNIKTITLFEDGGSGTVIVTSASHGYGNGDTIKIGNTTNYNGVFVISAATTDTFEITHPWEGDDAIGSISDASLPSWPSLTADPGRA